MYFFQEIRDSWSAHRSVVLWFVLNISFSSLWDLQVSKEWTSDLGIFTVYSFTKIWCNSCCSSESVECFQKSMGDFFFFFFCHWITLTSNLPVPRRVKPLPFSNLNILDNQFQIPSFKGLFLGITSVACTFYFFSFCPWLNIKTKVLYTWSHYFSYNSTYR